MQAGKLKHQVVLQQKIPASPPLNQFGESDFIWTDVATVWASVEPLQGRALELAQAIQSEVTGRITIRWRNGVTTEMRATFESKIYDIKAVINPKEIHRQLVLYTSEGLNDG